MSVKVSSKVWKMNLTTSEKITLLALADHADHDGKNAYPGNRLLAEKTGLSIRQVQRILDRMEALKVIAKTSAGGGRGQITGFEFNLEKMTPCHPLAALKDDTLSPFEKIKGDTGDTKRVTLTTRKGDTDDNPPRPPYKEETYLNVHEPCAQTARAREGAGRFAEKIYDEYTQALRQAGRGIRNPKGLAVTLWRSGSDDNEIQAWLDAGREFPAQAVENNGRYGGYESITQQRLAQTAERYEREDEENRRDDSEIENRLRLPGIH